MSPRQFHPLVTIITPTYNRAAYIEETIQSVLTQDYSPLEYIVLDDGSQDDTCKILQKYDARIRWESHPNMGETLTVNKGLRMAKGEIICIVNSDDPILPEAVNKIVARLTETPSALAAYPDWVEIDSNSNRLKNRSLPDYNIQNMLVKFDVGMGPGTFFYREALDKYGSRDINRKYTGDLEFWFRLALHGKLVHVPEILATHRVHPESISVRERSSIMGKELINIVDEIYLSPTLPAELLQNKRTVYSNAHYMASFYCTHEFLQRTGYLLQAVYYDPKYMAVVLYDNVRSALSSYIQLLFNWLVIDLQKILPTRIYTSLRNLWRVINTNR